MCQVHQFQISLVWQNVFVSVIIEVIANLVQNVSLPTDAVSAGNMVMEHLTVARLAKVVVVGDQGVEEMLQMEGKADQDILLLHPHQLWVKQSTDFSHGH